MDGAHVTDLTGGVVRRGRPTGFFGLVCIVKSPVVAGQWLLFGVLRHKNKSVRDSSENFIANIF